MNIGIEENTKLIYEATSMHGHPLWPSPVLLQVTIGAEEDSTLVAAKPNDLAPQTLLFREDSYDASTRVRRGRLYKAGDIPTVEWWVYPHPALGEEPLADGGSQGTRRKRVYAFSSIRLRSYLSGRNIHRAVFMLGVENGATIWTLINVETSATGDEIVVLRARRSIGALPRLDRVAISDADGRSVLDALDRLEEELFQARPESIVDRSRDAATAILSKYLQSIGKVEAGKDLAYLANKVADAGFDVVANSAKILARLHARGKHAERERRPMRPITERDAEFSVQAVGAILCDLGWATW